MKSLSPYLGWLLMAAVILAAVVLSNLSPSRCAENEHLSRGLIRECLPDEPGVRR